MSELTKEILNKEEITIDDLARMMTIEFFSIEERMATKEDLKKIEERMATKEDLKQLEARMASKSDLLQLEDRLVHRSEFDQLALRVTTSEDK